MNAQDYNPSTLQKRKGVWYVCVTKPKELQFSKDKQARRSTGTADHKLAQRRQHQLTQEIYNSFDKQLDRTDPFFESIRHILEEEGVRTREWYTQGSVTGRFSVQDEPDEDDPFHGFVDNRNWSATATDHLGLIMLLNRWGRALPAHSLQYLDVETRKKVTDPNFWQYTPSEIVNLSKFLDQVPEEFDLNAVAEKLTRPTKVAAPVVEVRQDPALKDVLDAFLATRTAKQARGERIQLRKWVDSTFGDIPLKDISQYDAYDYFNELAETLTKSSIKVNRAALSNVFKWAGKQRDLGITLNPFRGLDLQQVGKDGTERRPFTAAELHQLFKHPSLDQTHRDALTILITTGMRGGELELVTQEDVRTHDGIRYIDLTSKKLKTKGSKRRVPLHPASQKVQFPLNYNRPQLNALIRKLFDDTGLSLHSLRHTFKDLARDAGIPKDIQDFITGHGQGDEASNYGVGPSISKRFEAITTINHPWLK